MSTTTPETVSPGAPPHRDRGDVIAAAVKDLAWWCVRLLVIGAAAYALWLGLSAAGKALMPVAIALITTAVLRPVVVRLRTILPATLAALLVVLAALGLAGAVVFSIAPDVVRQSHTLYYQAVQGVQQLELWLQGPPFNVADDDLDRWFTDGAAWLQQRMGLIAGQVFAGIGMAGGAIVTALVVTVLTFFFLKDGEKVVPWLATVAGKRAGVHLVELSTRCWVTLTGFIRAQALVSALDAIFIGLGLVILGVPMALALATLTFIAGFVPIVGAVVAGALAVLVTFVSHGMTHAIIVAILVIAVQQLEGNILSPILQSRAVNLHPVIVLLSVLVGSARFGIPGAFFAVPVAALIAVTFRYASSLIDIATGDTTAAEVFRYATPPTPAAAASAATRAGAAHVTDADPGAEEKPTPTT